MAAPSALTLWASRDVTSIVLSSGCDSIDALLDGGFRSGLLTEVCGEAGAGKTQVGLQLLLQCRLPRSLGGLQGTACYICTEGVISIKRLHELAHVYARRHDKAAVFGGRGKGNAVK
uniref:RecA family profile 1 domain-containing protein n=1 Tax=Peronospora matthiolae TaxID=2874970 RepID=A0AAV1TVF1_9STRA